MVKIFRYLRRKEWAMIAVCLGLVVYQVSLDLKLPDYMSQITLLVQTEGSAMSEILVAGGYMLLCAIGSLLTSFIVGFFSAKIAASFSMRLREKVYDKTVSFSMEEISHFSTASLITRSTNDITQIQMLVAMGLQAMVKAPILAVWAILKIAGKNFTFTMATGVAVCFLLLMISFIFVFAVPKSKLIQQLTDNLNRTTREHLTGLRVVRAYNAEGYQEERFEKANKDVTDANLFVGRVMAIMAPTMSLIMSGLTLSIYWIGAYLINAAAGPNKLLLFSDMVVFTSYAMQVIMAFMMLTMIFIMMPRASVSAKRILEVLDTHTKIKNGNIKNDKALDSKTKRKVEFRDVSFRYPDASDDILEGISFTANPGETVAFIGSTGSGKTSLINLVPRFYDCTCGEILVDGINVKDYDSKSLREKIGYVSQKAVMFSGTVKSNITFGDTGYSKSMDNHIAESVSTAQASDFVDVVGLDGSVSQGGSNLSGGQKQRLSIARAIYRKPEIFIFDDSFSALDYKTDRNLRTALEMQTKSATKLIVAQRISTIKDADKIVVLDDGKVVGIGRHRELLDNCEVYKEISLSQLSKEELENA